MIQKLISILAVIMLCAGVVGAQEKREQESGLASWLRNMRQKLDIVNPRKTLPVTTGVAGVRGAKKQEDAKLYWKGKRSDDQVSEAELAELKEAVGLLEEGKTEVAIKELEEFMKQYPDSALIPDAKKTLDLAKAAPKEEAKPAVKAGDPQRPASDAPAQAAPAGDAPAVPETTPKQQ